MRKTITFLKRSIFAVALMIFSVNTWSQMPSNGGFENGKTDWSSTGSASSTNPRTGSYSLLSLSTQAIGVVTHTNSNNIDILPLNYAHIIGWASCINTNGSVLIGFNFGGTERRTTATTVGTTYGKLSYRYQNASATLNATCTGRVFTRAAAGSPAAATQIYWDDVIMYQDANTTEDITKPVEPTALIGGTGTATSTTFTWTNGSETATTGTTLPAQTGIQATIILRAANSVSSTPVLNDQAIYSVAGGTSGPNMVNGTDWKVISASVGAAATSYTDNDGALVPGTTYKYAVVHRDMAYNYSIALVGTAATAAASEPTSKLVISSISNSTPTVGGTFNVTVVSKTASDVISNVTSDTQITLSKASGTGTIGGTLTGTITNGTNSVTISGVSFDTAETGVSITATPSTGMTDLTAATSSAFKVVEAVPTTKTSAVVLVSKTSSTISLSWTNGSGAGRIAVARLSSTSAVAPTAGTIYAANSTSFTDVSNATTGTGNVVIFNGTGSSATLTDLTPSTGYVVDMYEYSSNTNIANYTTTTSLGYTATYAVEPTVQASDIVFSNVALTSMTISCTAGDGSGRIIVVKAGNAVDASPVDGTYISSYNAAFGTSTALGTGNYVVSRTSNTVNVTGLNPNTTYHVSVWEYNGSQAPTNYLLTSPPSASQATLATIIVSTNTNLSTLPICPTCDVTVNNGVELTVNESRTFNSLTIAAGGKVTNDNASATILTISTDLTIESSANGTGTYVEKQNGALAVSGTTKVKQYLTTAAGGRNWFVSSPVASATSNVVKSVGANLLWSYTEANTGTVQWNEITETNTPLVVMAGYVAKPTADGVIEFTGGALNTGSKTSPTLTNNGVVSTGFNLVGNPYPSYVNWTDATKNNVSTSIWYRSKSTGAYLFQTYNVAGGGIGANGGSELVPPMQSFWVKATGSGASVTFENAARSHQDQSVTTNRLKAPAISNQQVLRLQVSNEINKDEAVIYFNDNASNGLDAYDSQKMWNNNNNIPELFTKVASEDLVINGMKSVTEIPQLALGFKTGQNNSFTIKATELKNFDTDTRIILKDNVLRTELDITEGAAYSFTSDVVNNASRFSILFRTPSLATGLGAANLTMKIIKTINNRLTISTNSDQNGIITISNALGQKLKSLPTTGSSTILNEEFGAGVYLISIKINGIIRTEKVILNQTR